MKTQKAHIKITFTEPTLATSPGNKEIMEEFKASKAPNAEAAKEELDSLPAEEQIEKASTVFPRDDQGLFLWDYQMRGFFKEAIASLIELGDCDISKWAYKRAVDQFLFVQPRRVRYHKPDGTPCLTPDGTLQRPLRATTMQGDRICLARAEQLNEGTWIEFDVVCQITENAKAKVARITLDTVRDCLERGQFVGFSQWRGGGYGRFTFEMTETEK